ncbi:tRNA (adenosine(37)-N6)-threonylcarbamoyltransferase complex transferase subunit TsaD [Pelodictyon phaeoclathratiforme]|jgi:N6-L-threonylcarbamoyladenine synthase|uniref:tRNA N6-adenosine threonylcarbamoyltransferase n=1 Tax=Pelodictyon phaeoclathratiforme (strain DSM 5477 / BU-1) TaxID=324925 RepID=TSAD_PELPB|nr:tRNA (adenosine(37)-N6)-threonylcarbamoyltransferase complex transferase subunit TsaD [Pelodictyon phaeoclathratiforme]B4SBN2.1 RecName: Full=tRNA N6-adenosine threonylcarbamoyltransferase; AltName: Full=N6-L-threonylcarbamoyladenine synthase; Short=t(6)A synthase; AltName: Full=t(6)A37 threonylcarbamoyladenosine biosynthesis protein TsaD; AltName: Full=tRNA threonylcarbamoyladenosine biosynthesis protein TsaD [Pelodictyon phaeoclathratiforme BU-1]ACF42557.1 metalloendopeptidase, glycoprotease
MNILGIETSCDETSGAVLCSGQVRSNVVSSQRCHAHFGGVVPELASREHERLIVSIVDAAVTEANITKNDLDVIAATAGPGLIGAVMVGLCFAQGMAYALQIPFVPVNHIEAHIFSPFIQEDPFHSSPEGAFVSLTVSGGHTLLSVVEPDLSYSVIGRTLDDAAGEAFDKTGKMLGLPYPAGPVIDKLAEKGDPAFHLFPRALTSKSQTSKNYLGNFDFSFSGLKTSVLTWLQKQSAEFIEHHKADIAASIQYAIVSVLVEKTIAAARSRGIKSVSIAGGVSANSALRRAMKEACKREGITLHVPGTVYSTDNAAMIATLAALKLSRGMKAECCYNIAPYASFAAGSRMA